MTNIDTLRLEPEALDRIVEAVQEVGVAGNEEDRHFDAQDVRAALDSLEERLRENGYTGGSLAISALPQARDGVDVLVYDEKRFYGLTQAEEAWQRDYKTRWHDKVESRVEDWLRRLSDLRSQMATWLSEASDLSTLIIFDLPPVTMSEELMRRFEVKPRQMPTFELRAGSQRVMRFLPKGLFIIGANGRVDLITKSAAPILVDRSKPCEPPPDWQLYFSKDRSKSVPLTADSFRELINSGLK